MELAQRICEVVDKGDLSQLGEILHQRDRSDNRSDRSPELLAAYHEILRVGRQNPNLSEIGCDADGESNSIKPSSLLKALLHVNNDDTTWTALSSTIDGLDGLSTNEGDLCIEVVHAFIVNLRSLAKEKDEQLDVSKIINRLYVLSHGILAPHRLDGGPKRQVSTHRMGYPKTLGIIPTVLAALDDLHDVNSSKPDGNDLACKVTVNDESSEDEFCMLDTHLEVEESSLSSQDERTGNCTRGHGMKRASDRLLTSMFVSVNNTHRMRARHNIRADAVLAMLQVAVDDIGMERLSTDIPLFNRTVTGLECLQFALDSVLHSSLSYYLNIEDEKIVLHDAIQDGRDVIPIEDYPSLIRCLFRMLDFDLAPSSHHFEETLLKTYHAAIVATNCELALEETEGCCREGNATTWSKLTSNTIASCISECSASTINRVLEACTRVSHCDNPRVPVWTSAKVVVLITSARALTVTESSSFEPFRPHLLQKMACERMHKMAAEQNPDVCLGNIDSDEEAGKALQVLLEMATRTQGRTRLSSREEEEEARESLTESYYSDSAGFLRRHPPCGRAHNDYCIGLQTLNSYIGLVGSSLKLGQDKQAVTTLSAAAFSVEFADRWLEVAYRLLDAESTSHKHDGEKNEQQRHDGKALALVAVVYIFFQIPKYQKGIVDNIRDRIVKSVGGCSYFDLTAIIAWSLVGNDTHQTSSALYKTIGETRYCTEVLRPLCDLLSTPAVSDNDVWWKGDRGMKYQSLYLLSRALIPVPMGRKVVLATARKHFDSSKIPSTESTFFALSTLLALIEGRHRAVSNELDDFGKEALSRLTDIIVQPQSNPCLTSAVMDWFLGELTEKVMFSKIDKHASLRLLRACSVVLLQLCRSERTVNCLGQPFFLSLAIDRVFALESCEVETKINVPQVQRLMVALYDDVYDHHCSSSPSPTGMLPTCTLLKPHILRIVLAQHSSLHSLLTKSDQVVKSGLATLVRDVNDVALSVDATVLVLVFQGLVRLIMNDELPIGGQSSEYVGKLIEFFRRAEHSFYGNDFQPRWTQTEIERAHPKPAKQASLKSEQLFELKQSIGLIISETLFRMWSKNNVIHEPLVLVGALAVQEKLRYQEKMRYGATREHRRSANELSCDSICGFFQLTAQHVPPLLQAKGSRNELLPELDLLVKSVLEQCYAISSGQLQPCSPLEDFELYSAVHALYFAIASEEPAHLMTAFVTEHYRANGVWEDDKTADDTISISNFTFKSLPTSNDLDDHVRFVREITLQAFSRALKSIALSSGKLAADKCETLLNSLLETLPQLCQDFDCCFHGYSGGITVSLMVEFLYVVESCLDAISSLFLSLPPSRLRTNKFKLSSVGQSSTLLWTMLKEETVKLSFLKDFISLCVDKIPSVLRRAESIAQEAISSNPPTKTLCDLLESCCDSVATGIYSSGQSCKETSETRSPNSNNERNKADPTFHATLTQNLSSPKALACAFECCFAAMDAIWDSASGKILEPKGSIGCTETSLNIRRIDEVAQLFITLYRFFESADSHGSQEPMAIAALLSFKGKLFLCATLEKMTNVLASSIGVIISKLSTPIRYLQIGEQSSLVLDESLRESLICFVGWLRSIEHNTAKFDNVSGSHLWCAIEQKRAAESKGDIRKLTDRLANIVRSHEYLEDDTRELTAAIDAKSNIGSLSDEISSLLSQFLPPVVGGCSMQRFSDLLHRCTQCVDNSMSKVREKCPSNVEDSTGDESESNDEIEGLTMPGKRHIRQLDVRRKSRKTTRKSRNDTIDEWLTLDNSKSNGKKHSSDSYMDLEDFIVDG